MTVTLYGPIEEKARFSGLPGGAVGGGGEGMAVHIIPIYTMLITPTYNKEVATDMSTPTCVGCIAGVVPTVAPLH